MSSMRLRLAVLVSLLATACSGGNAPAPEELPSLVGIWQHVSGPGLALEEVNGKIDFLELHDDGGGTGFASQSSGLIGCGHLIFAVVNEDVVRLDMGYEISTLFRFRMEGPNLVLIDEDGVETGFQPAVSVPPASVCGVATEVARAELPEEANGYSGLVNDGVNLYYESNDSNSVLPVSMSTLTVGTPITTLGTYGTPIAIQGNDFWGHCTCGNINEVRRMTTAGVMVDAIITGTDLAHDLSIRGGAFDGSRLWLSGYNYDTGRYELLKVNSAGEPDLLESALPMDPNLSLDSLAFSNGQFWSTAYMLGPVLVSFDPNSGRVTRTITLPQGLYYTSLSVNGNDAFLLAQSESNYQQQLVIHVTIP